MTTALQIQREIERIRCRVKPLKEIWIGFAFSREDEPHSKYGCQILEVHTGRKAPMTEKDELKLLRKIYSELPDHTKRQAEWPTFEKYLKEHECNCGEQHPYHNPRNQKE